MEVLLLILLSVTCWDPLWSLHSNKTVAEVPVELSNAFDDDTENELSSQLEEVDGRSGGWSSWSEWSPCSRSCDGGVSHQLRTCTSTSCRGEHVRYKICNMQVVIAFVCLAVANAGLVVPSAKILQGPSTKTTLVGPDGSVVSSAAIGGQIVTEEHPGVVGYSAPALSYHAAPAFIHATPVVAYASPVVAHSAQADAVIAGPSGTIATGKSIVAGSVVAPLAAHVVVPEALEGQYVHDYTETLYDDGSYKPHYY